MSGARTRKDVGGGGGRERESGGVITHSGPYTIPLCARCTDSAGNRDRTRLYMYRLGVLARL